ncbi:hypothetical protein V492_05691 [Pseudogymnoascus sp. VKM F-4246]|nr:hypothetical protein V492_05691 [Pseudogymnoascus sp. VKM F-4246]
MAAIYTRNEVIAMLLLERGAETNTHSGRYTNALALAAMKNNVALVQALLNAKVEYDLLLAAVVDLDLQIKVKSLRLVLMVAIWMDRLDIIEEILAYKEQRQLGNDVTSMASLILRHGRLETTFDTEFAPFIGYTALQLAVAASRPKAIEVVDRLLAAGANTNEAASNEGLTALQEAARNGNIYIVDILLRAGAAVNGISSYRGTALQAAAKYGHVTIVEMLLAAGAEVDGHVGGGSTALQAAAKYDHVTIVEMLLAAGAQVDKRGKGQGTALQAAALHGNFKVVKILLVAGAGVGPGGHLARSNAAKAGHIEMANLIGRALRGREEEEEARMDAAPA